MLKIENLRTLNKYGHSTLLISFHYYGERIYYIYNADIYCYVT